MAAVTVLTCAGACSTPQRWHGVPVSQPVQPASVHGTIDLLNGVETDGTTCRGADNWSYLSADTDVTAFDPKGIVVGATPLGIGVPLDMFDCQWTVQITVPHTGMYDLVIDGVDIGIVDTATPFELTISAPPHQGNQS